MGWSFVVFLPMVICGAAGCARSQLCCLCLQTQITLTLSSSIVCDVSVLYLPTSKIGSVFRAFERIEWCSMYHLFVLRSKLQAPDQISPPYIDFLSAYTLCGNGRRRGFDCHLAVKPSHIFLNHGISTLLFD